MLHQRLFLLNRRQVGPDPEGNSWVRIYSNNYITYLECELPCSLAICEITFLWSSVNTWRDYPYVTTHFHIHSGIVYAFGLLWVEFLPGLWSLVNTEGERERERSFGLLWIQGIFKRESPCLLVIYEKSAPATTYSAVECHCLVSLIAGKIALSPLHILAQNYPWCFNCDGCLPRVFFLSY